GSATRHHFRAAPSIQLSASQPSRPTRRKATDRAQALRHFAQRLRVNATFQRNPSAPLYAAGQQVLTAAVNLASIPGPLEITAVGSRWHLTTNARGPNFGCVGSSCRTTLPHVGRRIPGGSEWLWVGSFAFILSCFFCHSRLYRGKTLPSSNPGLPGRHFQRQSARTGKSRSMCR